MMRENFQQKFMYTGKGRFDMELQTQNCDFLLEVTCISQDLKELIIFFTAYLFSRIIQPVVTDETFACDQTVGN